MVNLTSILLLIGAALLVWVAVRGARRNRDAFTKENLTKTLGTLGWLTLMIIVVVALCVWMIKP